MKIVGIICEYNPLHLGHKKQLDAVRAHFGADSAIVCLMSGNFVQRGAPAILDKSLRAQAAIVSGADLVLELPLPYVLSSAEGFAAGGVKILSGFCDYLCFGAECSDTALLFQLSDALLSDAFPPMLRQELERGLSFPAARQAALEGMGLDASPLVSPNNILAVEYCKAIVCSGTAMLPFPIHRAGSYHDAQADRENPSATSIRALMQQQCPWSAYIPGPAADLFKDASLHTLAAGERAMLSRLRTMADVEFEALPFGSEGLWRKFMHACHSCATLEEIAQATKSKRYTRTRIDRMALCAFLGITAEALAAPVPYTRVLAFNDRGRAIVKLARNHGTFLNAGEPTQGAYADLEVRSGALYGLFSTDGPESPEIEKNRRVYYFKGDQIAKHDSQA